MRKSTSLFCLALIFLFAITSCQKETVVPETKEKAESVFASAGDRASMAKSLRTFVEQNPSFGISAKGNGNGAKFIAPVIIGMGQGIFVFDPSTLDYQIASFDSYVGEKDFFRENPDGTITMHMNSKNANASYEEGNFMEFEPRKYLYGENAQLTVNLTGNVIVWDFGGGFIIKFLEPDNSKATVFHGVGKVSANGEAPWHLLNVKMLTTSTGTNIYQFKIDDIMFKDKFSF